METIQTENFENSEKECFLRNSFLFYQNRERILNDSRMANAVVPIHLGMGTSKEYNARLGGYLRWWNDCAESIVETKDGRKGLIYYAVGNPCTGTCSKSFVTEDGQTERFRSSGFIAFLKPMCAAHERQREEGGVGFETYTLQQVAEILLAGIVKNK